MSVTVNDGALQWVAGIDNSELEKQVQKTIELITGIGDKVAEQTRAIDNLARKAAAGLAGYLSIEKLSEFFKDMVKVRGEFEQLQVAFTALLKSKEAADQFLEQAVELVSHTPFTLQEISESAKKLLAFGFSADTVLDTIKRLGDVAAGTGSSLSELTQLYGKVQEQGRLYARDIQSFASKGIPIYDELAKVLNVSTERVNKLVTAGRVGFPEVEKAIQNLTNQGGLFFNFMDEQSKTLAGQVRKFKDAFEDMLQALGQESEGFVSGFVQGATFLVKHYQDVIDVIKVLIIAYGSYKAAVIITNAVTAVATALNEGLSIGLIIQAKALQLAAAAQKLFSAALLSNPIALVVTGVAILTSALLVFNKTAHQVKTASDLMAEASEDAHSKFGEQEAAIKTLVGQLKNQLIAEGQRLNAYNELKRISPEIVAGLTFEEAKTKDLTGAVDAYIASLRQRITLESKQSKYAEALKQQQEAFDKAERIAKESGNRIETTTSKFSDVTGEHLATASTAYGNAARNFREASTAVQEIELELANTVGTTSQAIKARIDQLKKEQLIFGETDARYKQLGKTIDSLTISYNKALEAEKNGAGAILQTIEIIDEQIKELKKQQAEQSATSAKYKEFQKQIDDLEAKRKKITGDSKKELSKAENDLNSILEKRRTLVNSINDLERDSAQTGLTDKQKAIDGVNQKYDKQIRTLQEVNKEIDRYNKKHPGAPVPLFGQTDIDRINSARKQENSNIQYKIDADKFIESIDRKQRVFEAFQELVEQGNSQAIDKFSKTYKDDLQGFTSFVQLLQSQIDIIKRNRAIGEGNVGDDLVQEQLEKKLEKAQADQDEKEKERQLTRFNNALHQLETFNQQRLDINEKYNKLEKDLETSKGDFSVEDYQKRKDLVAKLRKEDLQALENDIIRQSDLYKRLNEDIIGFTRKQIKERIKEFEKLLKSDTTLTPEIRAAIQAAIGELKGVLVETNRITVSFTKISEDLDNIGSAFTDLGGALEGVNDDFSQMLSTMGDIIQVASDVVKAVAQFASGDITQGIASTAKAIAGIFAIGKKARESRIKAQQEIAAFQQQVLSGEIDVNILYRQRFAQQASINKIKLQGIKDEADALKKNRDQNLKDYNQVLALLQNESFVSGQRTKKSGGILGIGGTTKVVNELGSLAGLNFGQLNELFLEGRLTDKAKELFQTLQKLKQEGVDIDQQLEDLKQQAKELFTGTTASSITSAILQGLKDGKRGIADFADDFEGLMKDAILNSLSVRALEGPINDFFDQFAADVQSGNQLDQGEIDRLHNLYTSIIDNATSQFEQLQDIAGINFSSDPGSGNALVGAIKGMTEQSAELLAGQFGGLRLTALDQLTVAKQNLNVLQNIESNTARLLPMYDLWRRLELNGIKVI